MSEDFMPYEICSVTVEKQGKRVLILGMGMDSVIKFSNMVDNELVGKCIKVEKSFNCNVDVDISGKDLKQLIEEQYLQVIDEAKKEIEDSEIYRIVCYDMS